MNQKMLFLLTAMALAAAPQFALADGDGAVTEVVGGAVAGALVGGPVGARRRRCCGRRNRKLGFGTGDGRRAAGFTLRFEHDANDKC